MTNPFEDQPAPASPDVWAPVPEGFQDRTYFASIVPDGPVWRPGPFRLTAAAPVGNYRTLHQLAANPPADCGRRIYAIAMAPCDDDPMVPAFTWREVVVDAG